MVLVIAAPALHIPGQSGQDDLEVFAGRPEEGGAEVENLFQGCPFSQNQLTKNVVGAILPTFWQDQLTIL